MGALYEATIPAFILGLGNLRSWLGKAEQHAAGGSVAVSDLLEARLAPDMFNLIQQVGYAYFTALEAAEHLSGREPPEMGYDETSMDELRASIDRVTEYLRSIGPDDVAPRESTEVETFLLPGSRLPIAGYVRRAALPNFYFHVVTAYGLLRHKGVPLGKADYIGDITGR